MIVNLVTPCIRPYSLPAIFQSIKEAFANSPVEKVRWYIIFDHGKVPTALTWRGTIELPTQSSKVIPEKIPSWLEIHLDTQTRPESIGGNVQRNRALDLIDTGWVAFLDDDTILHPDFFKLIVSNLTEGKVALIFGQKLMTSEEATRIVESVNVAQENAIDTGQFVVDRNFIGNLRWQVDLCPADGKFIREICEKYLGKVVVTTDLGSYYNYLSGNNSELLKPMPPSGWDESYYLEKNLDVREAVKKGVYTSGWEHWRRIGKSEFRKFKLVLT